MTMAQDYLNKFDEDTHTDTHKILKDHQWELSSVKKTAPLVSTHIYRNPKHPDHEMHVTNLSGSMKHVSRSKTKDGFAQQITTNVPFGKAKEYVVQFHKDKDDKPLTKEPLSKTTAKKKLATVEPKKKQLVYDLKKYMPKTPKAEVKK